MAGRPLAIQGTQKSWQRRPNLDALPYCDALPDQLKLEAEMLIAEEGSRGIKRPADYLPELPPMPGPHFAGHPVLHHEYERVKAKESMQPLDTARYRLDRPAQSKTNDVSAWKSSVDNAHSQLEHQYNRIQNLELLLKYGDKSWRAQIMLDEATLKHMDSELQATRKKVTDINQERKLSQSAAGDALRRAEADYYTLVNKNMMIEAACESLEQELIALKANLAARVAAPALAPAQANGAAPAAGVQDSNYAANNNAAAIVDTDMKQGEGQGEAQAHSEGGSSITRASS